MTLEAALLSAVARGGVVLLEEGRLGEGGPASLRVTVTLAGAVLVEELELEAGERAGDVRLESGALADLIDGMVARAWARPARTAGAEW